MQILLIYMYLFNVLSVSRRYFNKRKRKSLLSKLPALSLEILISRGIKYRAEEVFDRFIHDSYSDIGNLS